MVSRCSGDGVVVGRLWKGWMPTWKVRVIQFKTHLFIDPPRGPAESWTTRVK